MSGQSSSWCVDLNRRKDIANQGCPIVLQCLSITFQAFRQPIMTFSVRETLINNLKGETIRIPDVGNILPGWPQGVNSEVEELRDEIESWLDTYEYF